MIFLDNPGPGNQDVWPVCMMLVAMLIMLYNVAHGMCRRCTILGEFLEYIEP